MMLLMASLCVCVGRVGVKFLCCYSILLLALGQGYVPNRILFFIVVRIALVIFI